MKENRPIILWLISGCLLIFIMVIVGGITRLTDSGLSMVDWSIYGEFPTEKNILESYNDWQESPQGKQLHSTDFEEFKKIYFWEYIHRMIGRLLGLVFIIPFIYFLVKRKLNRKLISQSLVLFSMGSIQGAIGWWMVKSGLVDNPNVSHYRLAVHLITAFITFSYTFWVALPLIFTKERKGNTTFKKYTNILIIGIIIQIIYGGFIAGLNAGIGFNTWPKMNGEWIPEAVYQLDPLWRNFVEAPYGIQFFHRTLAIIIVLFIVYIWRKSKNFSLNNNQIKSLNTLFILIILQTLLGIFTLIYEVPISLAALHQIGAFFLLSAAVYSKFIFSKS